MKALIIILATFLTITSFANDPKELHLEKLNTTLFIGQLIQLKESSFGELYWYVYNYDVNDALKYTNLEDKAKGEVFKILAFKCLPDQNETTWMVVLKKENGDNVYVFGPEEAIEKNEIILLE